MKKITIISILTIVCCSSFVLLKSKPKIINLITSDIEAISDCEVTNKKGKVEFKCEGNPPEECTKTVLGHTLSCDGKEVEL